MRSCVVREDALERSCLYIENILVHVPKKKMHGKETLQNEEKGHSRKCKLLNLPLVIYETRNNDQYT